MTVTCERDGKGWLVCFGELECAVEDSVGMSYLAVLLGNPGYEIAALELAAGPDAASVDRGRSEHPFLDEAAVRAYRARLVSLSAEIDEYEEMHDRVRVERARTEYDWLVAELVSAVGLGGRPRGFSDNEERARVSVGKAIRRAINRIAALEPGIGEELRMTISTGMRCRYQPRPVRNPQARPSPPDQPSRAGSQSPAGQPSRAGSQSPAGQPSRAGSQSPAGQPSRVGQPLAARASVGARRAARIAG